MNIAKVFQSGNSQAIRIPKEIHPKATEYIIKQYGDCIYLLPKEDPWALLKQVIGTFPEDIMFERDQPSWDEIPERDFFE